MLFQDAIPGCAEGASVGTELEGLQPARGSRVPGCESGKSPPPQPGRCHAKRQGSMGRLENDGERQTGVCCQQASAAYREHELDLQRNGALPREDRREGTGGAR